MIKKKKDLKRKKKSIRNIKTKRNKKKIRKMNWTQNQNQINTHKCLETNLKAK